MVYNEIVELIHGLTVQSCAVSVDGELISNACSTTAEGLRWLARAGVVEIITDDGYRMVRAKFKPRAVNSEGNAI